MAFSFTSPAGGDMPDELKEVSVDDIGFKGLAGDANIRLLPTPWPADALPSPNTSLLTVAQSKGIVVGAGPDCLAVATTESVRKAIEAPSGEDHVRTKPFEPQALIPLPARPTHVAFTASDDALILATENGSQITVYRTDTLVQSDVQPALSVPTNGVSIRSLAPNPDPISTFVALVTANGELLIADLKAGNLISGANGPILRNGVSCVAWSNKGKQLVAGMADGSVDQMTPDGASKAQIPRPADLEGEVHVSSIGWLENDVFFIVYTPNDPEDPMGVPPSFYYVITRRKQAPFLIQKLPEPCSTMGGGPKRAPAYQFIVRLRDYKPNFKDVLIVASTASSEIGLIIRSEKQLEEGVPPGTFALAGLTDDTKRASVPLADTQDDTSVIGFAANLSSSENVSRPIPEEEISESATPLPGLFLLNNEGVLSSWWFIYAEAIRQNIPYSGLVSATQPSQMSSQPVPAPSASAPTHQQPSFGSPSQFGTSGFGKPSGASTFGSPSTMGATAFGKPSFGSPSGLGGSAAPAFGKPSFGTGTAFGQSSALGQPSFGQSGFGAASTSSPFGQTSTPGKSLLGPGSGTSGGGFSSFSTGAGGGGFAGFAAAKPGESPFAKASGDNAFAKASAPSPFGTKLSSDTAFPPAQTQQVKNPFGSAGGFVLGSSFKADGTAVNDLPKVEKPSSGALSFGGFGESISLSNRPSTPAESMDDSEDTTAPQPVEPKPVSLFGHPSKLAVPAPAPAPAPSLFGAQTTQPAKTSPLEITKPFSIFGTASSVANQSPFQASSEAQVTSPLSAPSDVTATPKREPSVTTPTFSSLEAPLPPDPTSRASYAPGDTSASSNVSKSSVEDAPLPPDFVTEKKPSHLFDDAPLPPDFVTQKKAAPDVEDAPLPPDFVTKPIKLESHGVPEEVPEEAPLPPEPIAFKAEAIPAEEAVPIPDGSDAESQDADESDFSDSGEEITHDETKMPSPKLSAGTSFGGLSDKSSTGGFFSGFSKTAPKEEPSQRPRQLFGEISKPPLLPPPGPATRSAREPYRSPSPTRISSQKSALFSKKPEGRHAGSALASRKASLTQIAQREGQLRKPSDTARQDQARAEAAVLRRAEEEVLALSDDDEDERVRADLARPIEPVATLDPFLPHQNYTGDTTKPGIPGMIERICRDITSMILTLGINDQTLSSWLMHQERAEGSEADEWVTILNRDDPAKVLDGEMFLKDINKLEYVIGALFQTLDEQRLQDVEEKLAECRKLLTKDVITLRVQFASLRKTLDALTDSGAIRSAPLSAEQATLQHDLRSTYANLLANVADLEQGVSMLRAKIADIPQPDGAGGGSRKRPTVEAVSSTIATMMSMVENKSSDIDVLEAHLKKLGIDTSSSRPTSREGSPFTTPRKPLGRFPTTPGSRGSIDGSAYHTPESASRGVNFRASVSGSAKHSRLRSVDVAGPMTVRENTSQWKAKSQRRKHMVGNLKNAIEKKEKKLRGVDDF